MQPISAWAATVQNDIDGTESVYRLEHAGYILNFHNTGDSLWMVAENGEMGRIAFRCVFAMQNTLNLSSCTFNNNILTLKLETGLGQYRVIMEIPDGKGSIFHYTTTLTTKKAFHIPYWPRDILPLTKNGSIENTSGSVHIQQVGPRTGQLFMSQTYPKAYSVFYFQNLTAIAEYCEDTRTDLAECVGGRWPELGFRLPVTEENPLHGGKAYIVSDAYITLSPHVPCDELEAVQQYLNYLAEIYLLVPKPGTKYHDWPEIARSSLGNLIENKGCWTHAEEHSYLNAYLCDYKTPPEIMVQLAVLLPLREYLKWSGETSPITDDLLNGLSFFYDDKVKTLVRWLPSLRKNLDGSEEQKKELVMDSWYLHHPLMNLSRLAIQGDKIAEKLLMDSIDYSINVAHHFNYQWPVFYKMDTLEIIKAETEKGAGGEHDVAGAYAHLMLQVWRLTQDKKYFNEAKKALLSLKGLGFRIFYQANNTAFAAGALLEVYKETREEIFLNLSYCCIAGIMKNVQLWDCKYGNGKYFENFFAVFPLNDAPYSAPYEEHEVFAAFHEYLTLAADIEILPSVTLLLCEFIKYAPSRLAYYYPPLLPLDLIGEEVKTGEINTEAWLPLEDLKGGWEQSGEVGQEVYGAGIGFAITPRRYIKINDEDFMIFSEYPLKNFTRRGNTVALQSHGAQNLTYKLMILLGKEATKKTFTVQYTGKKDMETISPVTTDKHNTYEVNGNSKVRITWK